MPAFVTTIIDHAHATRNLPLLTRNRDQRVIQEELTMTHRMKNIDVGLVYELWNEYAAAANAGDVERWLSLWTDDAVQMAPGEPARVGKQQIRAAMQPTFDLFIISNLLMRIEEVRILGDWAYSHGTYGFEMTPKEGEEIRSYSGKFLDILVKGADGSWKIAIDCHNYNEPNV